MGRMIHYGLVLTIIALVSAGLLAVVNQKTAPVIKNIEAKLVEDAQKEVLDGAVKFDKENVIVKDGVNFIPASDSNGKALGYVVSVSTPGYAGDIKFVMGITADYKVAGIKIIDSKETPGLGAKIGIDEIWRVHWNGIDSSYKFNKSIDGFAGATISPKAVYTGIIKTLKLIAGESSDSTAGATREGDSVE